MAFLDRDLLIQQVKSEYARLAEHVSRGHITDQSYGAIPPEAYYERTLQNTIRDISTGKFDDCSSGQQIVERIANNKTKVQRIQDSIESTLHNMELLYLLKDRLQKLILRIVLRTQVLKLFMNNRPSMREPC